MSLESGYAILTRLFVGCLALISLSVICWRLAVLYGDPAQLASLILIWRWYRGFLALSILYIVALRQTNWKWDRLLKLLGLSLHAIRLGWIFLGQIIQMPIEMLVFVAGGLLAVVGLVQLSHWFFRLMSVLISVIIFVTIGFRVVPTYQQTLDLQQWLASRPMSIHVQQSDTIDVLRDAKAQIVVYSGAQLQTYMLHELLSGIRLDSFDTIAYLSTDPRLSTTVTIHLPDGALLTLLPQSSVSLFSGGSAVSSMVGDIRRHRHINQGRVAFTDRLQRVSQDYWSIGSVSRRSDCRDGIMSVSASTELIQCLHARRAGGDGIISTGDIVFTGTSASPIPVSGQNQGVVLSPGVMSWSGGQWVKLTETGVLDQFIALSGLLTTHEVLRQEYRVSLDQRLDDQTRRTWSVSPLIERLIRLKMLMLSSRKPVQYSAQLKQFHLYQYIHGRYQGGLIDTGAIQQLNMWPQ